MAARRKSTRARRRRSRSVRRFYCVSKRENVTVPDDSICIGSFKLRNNKGTRYYKSSVCPDTQQKLVEFTSEDRHNQLRDLGYPKCKRKFKQRKSKNKSRRRKSKSKSARRKSKSKSKSARRKSKSKPRRRKSKSKSKSRSRKSKSRSRSQRRKSKSKSRSRKR